MSELNLDNPRILYFVRKDGEILLVFTIVWILSKLSLESLSMSNAKHIWILAFPALVITHMNDLNSDSGIVAAAPKS